MRMPGRRSLPPTLLAVLLLLGLTGALPGTAGDGGSSTGARIGKAAAVPEVSATGRGPAPLQVRDEGTTHPSAIDPAAGHAPAAPAWTTARTGSAAWSPSGATPATLLLVTPGRGPPH